MAKRFISLMAATLMLSMAVATVSAQEQEFEAFSDAFRSFGDGMVNTLPHYNSIGLQWSDAYIGQLLSVPPKFGIGASFGFVTIPGSVLTDTLDALGEDSSSLGELEGLATGIGLPIPGYTIDARVGGIGLPFDVGLKVGVLNDDVAALDDLTLDYMLLGADVRYRVFGGGVLLPKVSAGVGVNHSKVNIGVPGVFGENLEFAEFTANGDDYVLSLEDPDLVLDWKSTTVDLKAQASKRFLIFEPFLGAAASYSNSTIGGGARSQLLVSVDGGPPQSYDDLSDQEKEAIESELGDDYDLDDQSIGFFTPQSGWSARAFGGIGFRLLVFNLDIGASIDTTGSLGAQLNARLQL